MSVGAEWTQSSAYLGDGVYVTLGAQGLILTTGHHDPELADHLITLEPSVWANLCMVVRNATAVEPPKKEAEHD